MEDIVYVYLLFVLICVVVLLCSLLFVIKEEFMLNGNWLQRISYLTIAICSLYFVWSSYVEYFVMDYQTYAKYVPHTTVYSWITKSDRIVKGTSYISPIDSIRL